MNGIRRHPTMHGYALLPHGVMGDAECVPLTVELENLIRQNELQAVQAASALGDRATLQDFAAAYPRQQTAQTFQDFLLRHRCSGRHGVTLELEAKAHGLDLSGAAEHQAMTYQPQPAMAANPLKRQAKLMSPDALDSMAVSGGATLQELHSMGVVDATMSEQEFDSRLRRLRMQPEDRTRLCAAGYEQGWFRASAPGAVSAPFSGTPKADGDVWKEYSTDAPLKGYLKPGVVVNVDAQAKGVWLSQEKVAQWQQEVQAATALVQKVKAREEARRRGLQAKV